MFGGIEDARESKGVRSTGMRKKIVPHQQQRKGKKGEVNKEKKNGSSVKPVQ